MHNSLISQALGLDYKKQFIILVILHALIWTFVPTLLSPNAPLDVIEGYAWGNEWLAGTHKHPTLQAWLLEIGAWCTGKASFVHFFLSQMCIITAFWAIWRLGNLMLSPAASFLAVMLLETIIYYNFTTTEFNPNVLQITCWALIGYNFYAAICLNKTRYWIGLGLSAAAGMYSKYFTAILLAVLFLFFLIHPYSRSRLKNFGPYLAILVGSAAIAPQILWLLNNDLIPLTYTQQRLDLTHAAPLSGVTGFIIKQSIILIGLALSSILILPKKLANSQHNSLIDFNRYFLFLITWGPIGTLIGLGWVFGLQLKSMWGMPLWNFLTLWMIHTFSNPYIAALPKKSYRVIAAIFASYLAVYGAMTYYQPYFSHPKRIHFPGKEVAKIINSDWNQHHEKPLEYIVGDIWVAGNVSYYSHQRPHVLIDGDTKISPWINMDDLLHKGAVLAWTQSEHITQIPEPISKFTEYLPLKYTIQEQVVTPVTSATTPHLKLCWIILSPQP